MRLSGFLILACVLLPVVAQWRGCGDPCDNSNQCDDALCSKCEKGICRSGLTCGSSCIIDSDCERLRYCYACTAHKCSPGPNYPYQCKSCKKDSDCTSPNCKSCETETAGTQICSAGCGGNCTTNYDCGYHTKCSHCNPHTKTCEKGGDCGQRCGNDADCDQYGTCHLCIDFTCSVPCGQACLDSSECNAPVTGCGICNNGSCAPGVECGSPCVYNRDCATAGKCQQCVAGLCGIESCNSTCQSDAECGSTGECPSCLDGRCQKRQCGSSCYQDSDCANVGNCTSCTGGKCTVMQCGSHCTDHTQCAGLPGGCTTCGDNRCVKQSCGSPCTRDEECADAGSCTTCQDNACTQPIPPEDCGIHRPCTAGNNNQCPMHTCSRCDPFTNTCRLGGPCGAACIVATDCNQMADCKYCRDICVDLPGYIKILEKEDPAELKRFLAENPEAEATRMEHMARNAMRINN